MTREEQIRKQADIYTDDASNYTEWSDAGWSDSNDIELVEKAFIQGAKWADANPKSLWISVEEDLPCNHKELITTVAYCKKVTINVITIDKYGNIEGNYMILCDSKWEWEYDTVPCFWMPTPKLPNK